MKLGHLEVDDKQLQALCAKWRIARLEAFGSVLRDDFDAESDVDLLITFEEGARLDFGPIHDEFEALLGRKVDLIEPRLLKWVIRDRVLEEARLVYAA